MQINMTYLSSLGIIVLILGLSLHYWKHKYYKTLKFQQLGPYLSGIGTILICLSLIFQVSSYFKQRIEDKIKLYTDLNDSFLQPILSLFIQYPEMDYYYCDIFGIKQANKNFKRNYVLENQISMIIFAKIAIPAVYIELSQDSDMVKLTYDGLKKIIDTFMKSKIFVNYYVTDFKPNIAGPIVVEFMQKHYNV